MKNSSTIITSLLMGCILTFSLNGHSETTGATSTTVDPHAITTAEQARPHIGFQLGWANPEGSFEPTSQVGLDVGFQPYIPFGLGVELTYTNIDQMDGNASISRTELLAKATYNFGGSNDLISKTYVGLGAGSLFLNNGTKFVVAPLLGFDYPITTGMGNFATLGMVAKYAYVASSDPAMFTVSGMVKYWF